MNIRAKGLYAILLNPQRPANIDAHYYNEDRAMFALNIWQASKVLGSEFMKGGRYETIPSMRDIRLVHVGDIIPLNEEEDSE